MDFELPEELAEAQKLAHDFAEKDIAPSAAQDDREHRFRKDLVGKMGELGVYGCLIPEEFGGNGLGFLKKLRDRYQPDARIAILSNSSTIGDPAVHAALELLDLKIMKFDAGSEEMFRQLNHPAAPVYMGEIVAGLKEIKNTLLQSCFVQGRVTNADPDSVAMWIDKVREIHPLGVQVYTLDREPADKRIERVSLTTLRWIADAVRWRAGLQAEVF